MAQLIEILQEALQLEHDGEAFYRQAAASCASPLSRRTFETLADWEKTHAGYVQAHYDALSAGGSLGAGEWHTTDLADLAKGIFAQAKPELEAQATQACTTDHGLYETAMEKERMSIHLYRTQSESATDSAAQAFFTYLLGQERDHLELLSNTQKYLDNPADFFFDQEQWIVEG
ncbi:MAG TPA: ferritin family protein [Armatimonadota bacterium]|jgi:rubrerythrin